MLAMKLLFGSVGLKFKHLHHQLCTVIIGQWKNHQYVLLFDLILVL